MNEKELADGIIAAATRAGRRQAAAAAPARITAIEFTPPQGANLARCIECARGILAGHLEDAPAVSFVHEGVRVTVKREGAL